MQTGQIIFRIRRLQLYKAMLLNAGKQAQVRARGRTAVHKYRTDNGLTDNKAIVC